MTVKMNKKLGLAVVGIVLLTLLAWSSLASAAPSAGGAALAPAAVTATPAPTSVDVGPDNPSDNGPLAPAAPVNPDPMTSRIFIFNLDTVNSAIVSIKFYTSTGQVLATVSPPAIKPNGAVGVALPASIPAGFRGSALVSSNRNVQAFVTDSNAKNLARDEYDGTGAPNPNLVLPFVRHLAPNTQNSIIAVQNTGAAPADITLQLYQTNGSLGPSKKITGVAPFASAYFNTNNITGLIAPFRGSAEISSSGGVALAGSEQTRYLQDTASFRALSSADDAPTLYVGFVERRKNSTGTLVSWSEMYVRNDGAASTNITATLYSAAGTKALAVVRSQVPPNGLAQFLTNAADFKSLTNSTAYFKGWAVITSGPTQQPMSLYSLEAQNGGSRLFGLNGVTATGSKFACGDTFRYASPAQNSSINIVNPNGAAASVTVKLYKQDGTPAGSKTVSVAARRLVTISPSATEFAAAGSSFEGLAVVSATGQKVFVTVYTAYSGGGVTSYSCARLQ